MTSKTNKVTFDKFRPYHYEDEAYKDFYLDNEWFGYIHKFTNGGRVCNYQVYFVNPDIEAAEFTVRFGRNLDARSTLAAAKDYIRAQAQKCKSEPAKEGFTGCCCWPR